MVEGKPITLAPLPPKEIYNDQLRIKRACEEEAAKIREIEKSENKSELSDTKSASELSETKKTIKKERLEQPREKRKETERKVSIYVKASNVKRALFMNQPMYVLMYKEAYFSTNELRNYLPSVIVSLLQDFEDVFPEETPSGLLPKRRIEHHIDLIPSAAIQNILALDVILRKRRKYKNKLVSSWRRGTLGRA